MLALKTISLEERKATERFFALVRKATSQMRVMAEWYDGDVPFNLDSNGRSVWVMALFGKGAPPLTLLRDGATPRRLLRMSGQQPVPWTPLDDEQDGDEEGEDRV